MAGVTRATTPLALARDGAGYAAVRLATAALLAAGPRPATRAARGLGRRFARSRPNRRRLARAEANLAIAFPGWTNEDRHRCAVASYEHLFMLAAEIAYGPRLLTESGWHRHVIAGDLDMILPDLVSGRPAVLITGHCGNWEVLGYTIAMLGFPMHALYRPLDSAPLDRWIRRTREQRGLVLVDKFGAVHRLPALVRAGAPMGFVADQNGGDRGVFVPFFNRLASTYKSIGLLALQYDARVICGVARRADPWAEARDGPTDRAALSRAGFARPDEFCYRFEATDSFGPEDWRDRPDPLFYLTARYRRAIEAMVLRAPDQYLWMHRIWRSRPRHERLGRPFPDTLRDKLRALPWITDADMAAIEDHSDRDARTLAATGESRLS